MEKKTLIIPKKQFTDKMVDAANYLIGKNILTNDPDGGNPKIVGGNPKIVDFFNLCADLLEGKVTIYEEFPEKEMLPLEHGGATALLTLILAQDINFYVILMNAYQTKDFRRLISYMIDVERRLPPEDINSSKKIGDIVEKCPDDVEP